METTETIRERLKRQRKQLSPGQRQDMNRQLCRHLIDSRQLKHARTLAAYLPFGGEPDLTPVLRHAVDQGIQPLLPVVVNEPEPKLHFRVWQPGESLTKNRFGIPEPASGAKEIPARALDLILLPLVAFDAHGNRIGMGAGYYDRTFAFLLDSEPPPRPVLIGTGWSFQQLPRLEPQAWDVPLDAVVTEHGWHGPWRRAAAKA